MMFTVTLLIWVSKTTPKETVYFPLGTISESHVPVTIMTDVWTMTIWPKNNLDSLHLYDDLYVRPCAESCMCNLSMK
jgi:hypothetical protein